MSSRMMSRRLTMTQRLYFACIALALASTGMSCNQNAEDVPPVQTGGAEAVEVVDPYEVVFETTAGNFTVEVHPDWSPNGAARFKELIDIGYYDGCRFFRVVPGFMVQWGMNGNPQLNSQWSDNNIQDDPVVKSNTRGYMTFAKTGAPNSRSTQLFINYADNSQLDGQGFSPFAIVTEGMDVVDKINPEYREQPNQGAIAQAGNAYLTANFPKLDYILKASYKDGGGEQTANKPVNEEGEKESGEATDTGSGEESSETESGAEGETSECGVDLNEFPLECDDPEKVIGDPAPEEKPATEEKDDKDSKKPFEVKFETTAGDFVLEVHPEWAPIGAARFKELVEKKYYDECRFFRVLPGFVVQWGMNGDPKVNAEWSEKKIKDDPVKESNKKGFVTYAKSPAPNSRTTQLFINLRDNERLDELDFAPFAKVKKGMDVVEKINAEYRQDPDQGRIAATGNEYLKENFPRLDSIRKARIVKPKKDGKKEDAKKESKAAE